MRGINPIFLVLSDISDQFFECPGNQIVRIAWLERRHWSLGE